MFHKKDPRLIAAEAIPELVKETLKVPATLQEWTLNSVRNLIGIETSKEEKARGLDVLLGVNRIKQTWEDTQTPGGLPVTPGNGKDRK